MTMAADGYQLGLRLHQIRVRAGAQPDSRAIRAGMLRHDRERLCSSDPVLFHAADHHGSKATSARLGSGRRRHGATFHRIVPSQAGGLIRIAVEV